MIDFVTWSKEYDEFKKVVKPVVMSDIPTEPQLLSAENQVLPRLLAAAREHQAMAAYFERQFKESKQSMAQVIWAKKDSEGVADVLKTRSIAISVAMRPQA